MAAQGLSRPHYLHLDMLRGLAAVAVVVGHLRGCLMLDHGQLATAAHWQIAFYFAGGLGHQAVVLFFALSGFLVGGKALADLQAGLWSWQNYLAARFSRLWTVVLPALAVTFLCDSLGMAYSPVDGAYRGTLFSALSSGPSTQPVNHSVGTLIANAAFLQTIVAPVYGSNGPLWSLANEFWYYIAFPLIGAGVWLRYTRQWRMLLIAAGLILLWILPRTLAMLGAIWLAGACAHFLIRRPVVARFAANRLCLVVTLVLALLASAAGFHYRGVVSDLAIGFVYAGLLVVLACAQAPGPSLFGHFYTRAAKGLSEISYTLYAFHFPILFLAYTTLIAPKQWPPGLAVAGLGIALLFGLLAISGVLWWLFERNTAVVRSLLLRLMTRRRTN